MAYIQPCSSKDLMAPKSSEEEKGISANSSLPLHIPTWPLMVFLTPETKFQGAADPLHKIHTDCQVHLNTVKELHMKVIVSCT